MQPKIILVETRRILLRVNDQPTIEPELWNWLFSRGVAVLHAATTKRALELLKKAQVDLILSDLARQEGEILNKKAGLQLAQEVRSIPSPVPLCIFTNHKDPAVHALARDAGANYVTESTLDLIRWLDQMGL